MNSVRKTTTRSGSRAYCVDPTEDTGMDCILGVQWVFFRCVIAVPCSAHTKCSLPLYSLAFRCASFTRLLLVPVLTTPVSSVSRLLTYGRLSSNRARAVQKVPIACEQATFYEGKSTIGKHFLECPSSEAFGQQ